MPPPDVFPTFTQQYTDSFTENSLIVEAGERYRYVDYNDIFVMDYTSYYYYGTENWSFCGESELTSAIDYVVSENLPKVYLLTGHGESSLSDSFTSAVKQQNIETAELSLLTLESVPADADCILINAPQSDISLDEQSKLREYLGNGGNLFLITDPPKNEKLSNLEALMADYGVSTVDGIVVESDQSHYVWGTPYFLLPDIASHAITTPLTDGGYRVLLPISQGLTVADDLRDTLSVTKLLTTSSSAFAKAAGYDLTTYEKEEEDVNIDADYIVDEKAKTATLTARGVKKAEEYFGLENLSDPENSTIAHHINQAIKAHGTMKRDIDYVIKDGQVVIVDEFTGRLMFGRRYSDGLHQAIEAKEHVEVARESKTLATITFQNYFRLYGKLSGMTGTALTEEEEFGTIYNLDIIEIPTNRPIARIDDPDVVYKTEAAKYRAVIEQVKACHAKGQPVLVGTVSIEKNEKLSYLLSREGIKHNLLNAKNHEKEAEIVAQAGKLGAVTVATNMAGRGTDIMLGGNAEYMAKTDLRKAGLSDELIAEATGYAETDNKEILDARDMFAKALEKHREEISGEADKVREAGGLFIIGTERHDSRRIDNQLRGRAGRQGDPGETRFYLSLEDDLLRLFGGERITNLMERFNLDEDTPIENKTLSKAIENAQTSVESRNFQYRKSTLEYDDVMNKQREIIYGQRKQVLDGMDIKQTVLNMLRSSIESQVAFAFGEHDKTDDEHRADALKSCEGTYFPRGAVDANSLSGLSADDLTDRFYEAAEKYYEAKEAAVTSPIMRELERVVLLRVVDEYWMDHIDAMSELRQAIRLQSYGNNKPIDVYKQESLTMFEDMISAIQGDTVRRIFSARVKTEGEVKRERVADGIVASTSGDGTVKKQPRKVQKIGRNDPCPCGSGKKYKQCCGR